MNTLWQAAGLRCRPSKISNASRQYVHRFDRKVTTRVAGGQVPSCTSSAIPRLMRALLLGMAEPEGFRDSSCSHLRIAKVIGIIGGTKGDLKRSYSVNTRYMLNLKYGGCLNEDIYSGAYADGCSVVEDFFARPPQCVE